MDDNLGKVNINHNKTDIIRQQIEKETQLEILGKTEKRPETKLWWYDRLIHKMEVNRIIVFDDQEETIKLSIWKWDYLQFNNQKIWGKEEREEKITNITLSDKSLERSEIETKDHYYLNRSYRFKFDFFIPEDFPIIDNRLVIWQRKQQFMEWTKNNPIIAQRFRNWKYSISVNLNWDPKSNWWNNIVCELDKKEILWKRINSIYEIRFSENEHGYIKIRYNGNLLREYNWKVSSSSSEYPIWEYYKDYFFFKFWLYRDTYQKRLLELENGEDTLENSEKIDSIELAIKNENEWKLMSIYFKNYRVEEIK